MRTFQEMLVENQIEELSDQITRMENRLAANEPFMKAWEVRRLEEKIEEMCEQLEIYVDELSRLQGRSAFEVHIDGDGLVDRFELIVDRSDNHQPSTFNHQLSVECQSELDELHEELREAERVLWIRQSYEPDGVVWERQRELDDLRENLQEAEMEMERLKDRESGVGFQVSPDPCPLIPVVSPDPCPLIPVASLYPVPSAIIPCTVSDHTLYNQPSPKPKRKKARLKAA